MALSETQKKSRKLLAQFYAAFLLYDSTLKNVDPFSRLQKLSFLNDGGFIYGIYRPFCKCLSADLDKCFKNQELYFNADHLNMFQNYNEVGDVEKYFAALAPQQQTNSQVTQTQTTTSQNTSPQSEPMSEHERIALVESIYPSYFYKYLANSFITLTPDSDGDIPVSTCFSMSSSDLTDIKNILSSANISQYITALMQRPEFSFYTTTLSFIQSFC